MQTVTRKNLSSYILAFSLLLLTLLVAACGSNAGSGGTGGTGSTGSTPVKASPTAVKGYGTAQGCPSDLVVNTAPPTANVIVKRLSADASTMAHVGDVIEVRLPFGHQWSGPILSSGNLQVQQPAGYAWKSDSVCIWRFVAKSAGTATLNFTSRPLCKPRQMCPMYIAEIPLTITVK
jgi:hypothetical protein